ncbi:MAG: hypothetical protein FJ088_09160 [Deltaproteobacteria bacterium]|nr:hypothetical protein [Deltaproteobacteria bacterium]
MTKSLKENAGFLLILLIYFAYSLIFILRTSFTIEGERFFSLFDDAMISMRYAKNFAEGHGLVFNPSGERVEGFTNPLWVLYMAVFHLLPVAQSKISLFIQLSGAFFLAVNLIYVKKIAGMLSNENRFVSYSAVVLTAFYLPLNTYGLQGTETGLLALFVSLVSYLALKCIAAGDFKKSIFVLLGIGTLVRIDMAVFYIVIFLFALALFPSQRHRNLIYGIFVFLLFAAGQTLFRVVYYDDVLPNTYYLKMTGYPLLLRVARGFFVYWQFIKGMNPVIFATPFVLTLFRRDRSALFLFAVFLAQSLYSVYVGGDAWEKWGGSNRFISIAMPLFFVLFAMSVEELRLFISEHSRIRESRFKYAACFLIIAALVSFNSYGGAKSIKESLLLKDSLHVFDNRIAADMALAVKKATTLDASIAVVWSGAIPYFSERPTVDLLGKNDRKIARTAMRQSPGEDGLTFFWPGHLKLDYSYSIGELKPDVLVQICIDRLCDYMNEAVPFIKGVYGKARIGGHTMFVRTGSANILWEKILLADH